MVERARNTVDRTWNFMARIPSSVVLVIAIFGFTGTVLALVIVIPLSGRVAKQAQSGSKARATQCDREPVIRKVAQAAFAVRRALPKGSRITDGELKLFMAQAPRGCPKAKK